MTLTPIQRSDAYETFDRVLGVRMERIFEQSMFGEVNWNGDLWGALLDWIQGPLRQRMYSKWVEENPTTSIEKHPSYQAFEIFDRARIQGVLEKGDLIRVVFSAVNEGRNLIDSGLQYFGVSLKPPPSDFEQKYAEAHP